MAGCTLRKKTFELQAGCSFSKVVAENCTLQEKYKLRIAGCTLRKVLTENCRLPFYKRELQISHKKSIN